MNDDDKRMGWRIYNAFSDLKRIPCFCHDLNFDMCKLQDDIYDYFELETIDVEGEELLPLTMELIDECIENIKKNDLDL